MKKQDKKILITGGTGFLGRALCERLNSHGFMLRASVRKEATGIPENVEVVRAELSPTFDWSFSLQDIDTLLHVAARVHIVHDRVSDSLKEFRITNVDSTLNLARQAALAGVRRFIFISTIGVNGVATLNKPFSAHDEAAPNSPYAISKHEAELGLRALACETGMEIVIIRPPIIYGLNSPGNFGSLVRWLEYGLPLPLGAVTQNRRSLVGLDNLVDLILTCIDHPKAANQTFLVSDGEDLSTTELLKKIGNAMNRPTRLFRVPFEFLDFVIRFLGKKSLAQSLLGSLQIDISYTCKLLDWKPPVSVDEGLRRATQQRV